HVDGIRPSAGLRKRHIQISRPIEAEDLGPLRNDRVAGAAIDEHPPPVTLDEHGSHRQYDPTLIVRRHPRLPQRARHDSKHGPAVQPYRTVADGGHLQISDSVCRHRLLHAWARGLLQFDEHAVRRGGMDKRNKGAFGAGPWSRVYEPGPA